MALRAVEGRSGWPQRLSKPVAASGICPVGHWEADCPGRKITKCGAGPYRPETPTDCRGGRATTVPRRRSIRDAAASFARAPPPRNGQPRRLRAGCGELCLSALLARPLLVPARSVRPGDHAHREAVSYASRGEEQGNRLESGHDARREAVWCPSGMKDTGCRRGWEGKKCKIINKSLAI